MELKNPKKKPKKWARSKSGRQQQQAGWANWYLFADVHDKWLEDLVTKVLECKRVFSASTACRMHSICSILISRIINK